MARAAGAAFFAVLATPAFAAGEGGPWWFLAVSYLGTIAPLILLAVGLGFFLQGFLRLRSAVIALIILSVGFLAWLATSYGLEKTVRGLPLFGVLLALLSPFFGLGWFIAIKDAIRRSDRKIALNAGSNHG
jgi:hypothetical protein